MTKTAKKILLCEDDELLREMYALKLEKAGYEVVKAVDGQESLDKAKGENPKLILLDVMMPKMDGFQVLQNLRKESKLSKTPIIMLTNLGQEEDIKKGQEFGATDYVVKSNVTPQQVVEKVEKTIKK